MSNSKTLSPLAEGEIIIYNWRCDVLCEAGCPTKELAEELAADRGVDLHVAEALFRGAREQGYSHREIIQMARNLLPTED